MTKRLFIAINLPSNIKEQLANLLLKLQKDNKNKPIRWVKPDNLHLTLHFLGDTPEEQILEINNNLKAIISNFTTLNFKLSDSINAFPDLHNPRVIFLEMNELNDGQTIKLQKQIGESLEGLGFAIDKRPFRLHLTLGRLKFKTNIQIPNSQPTLAVANINRNYKILISWPTMVGEGQFLISNFKINSIDLMVSQLTPAGPIYSLVKSYNLS